MRVISRQGIDEVRPDSNRMRAAGVEGVIEVNGIGLADADGLDVGGNTDVLAIDREMEIEITGVFAALVRHRNGDLRRAIDADQSRFDCNISNRNIRCACISTKREKPALICLRTSACATRSGVPRGCVTDLPVGLLLIGCNQKKLPDIAAALDQFAGESYCLRNRAIGHAGAS